MTFCTNAHCHDGLFGKKREERGNALCRTALLPGAVR